MQPLEPGNVDQVIAAGFRQMERREQKNTSPEKGVAKEPEKSPSLEEKVTPRKRKAPQKSPDEKEKPKEKKVPRSKEKASKKASAQQKEKNVTKKKEKTLKKPARSTKCAAEPKKPDGEKLDTEALKKKLHSVTWKFATFFSTHQSWLPTAIFVLQISFPVTKVYSVAWSQGRQAGYTGVERQREGAAARKKLLNSKYF